MIFKNFEVLRIKIADSVEDIRPLHEAHYAETEVNYKTHQVAVNYAHMIDCEAKDLMVCFGARLVDSGQLVAYNFYYLSRSAHDSSMVALPDAYYLIPEHRGSGVARRLLQVSAAGLKELGVDYMFMTDKSPVGGPHIGMFLESEGFKKTSIAYSKAL